MGSVTTNSLAPLLALAVCAAGYGSAVGMLLPRAVYRLSVPPKEPPRRHCPAGHDLQGPASGWLGFPRCQTCTLGGQFGPRPTFFVLAGAVCCAALAAAVGARPELAVGLLFVPFGLLLAAVDRCVHRLPDRVTLPLAVGVVVLLGVAALLPGAAGSWTGALAGGAALAGGFFVLFLLHPRGVGFGDVKLALAVGVALGWYGWPALFLGAFLGFLLAAGHGAVLLLTGRAEWKTSVPFGPFMLLGAFFGVLAGALTR